MSKTYDIAVVGAGSAGLPAAIVAARRGAKVALIEAADTVGGTLHLSSGSLSSGGSALQAAHGIKDSPERHYADCVKLGHGTADDAILRLWAEHAPRMTDWLAGEGVDLGKGPVLSPGHEFYDTPRTFNIPGGAIAAIPVLAASLDEQVQAGAVDLMLSTRMTGLIEGDAGAVTGVAVESADGPAVIAAAKVVLTVGGYSQNDAMWAQFHGAMPRRVYSYPYSQGDGIRAAQELGAATGNGHNFLCTFGATEDIDEPGKFWIHSRVSPAYRQPWEISVTARGERFMREDSASPDYRERALLAQPDQSFWVLWDARIAREAPPLFGWDEAKLARAFAQSDDFQCADTLAGLAQKCAMDAGLLAQTVATYNAGVAVNSDVMGRQFLPAQISEAPFYAVRHHSTSVVSWGGVIVDQELRVLRADGSPISNLHAGGEMLGMGVFGHTFLGGSTLSSSLTFGMLLGERLTA